MAIEKVKSLSSSDYHITQDRTIVNLLGDDSEGYNFERTRVTRFERNAELGNHWREYPEIYGVIGKATFTLEDIGTKEREVCSLETGDRIFIPPKVALKIQAKKGTVITSCSPKVDRDDATHKYIIE